VNSTSDEAPAFVDLAIGIPGIIRCEFERFRRNLGTVAKEWAVPSGLETILKGLVKGQERVGRVFVNKTPDSYRNMRILRKELGQTCRSDSELRAFRGQCLNLVLRAGLHTGLARALCARNCNALLVVWLWAGENPDFVGVDGHPGFAMVVGKVEAGHKHARILWGLRAHVKSLRLA